MPKKVYQCNFCCETHSDEEVIIKHEENCIYNPKLKKCGTCKFFNIEYGNTVCNEKENYTYEYFDEEKECPFHQKI